MFKQLTQLLGQPFNTTSTNKGQGTAEYYTVPEEKIEEVVKILGVEINEANLARCKNGPKGYKNPINLEVFHPEGKDQSTAQLYGIPFDQTTVPFVYLSAEVALN